MHAVMITTRLKPNLIDEAIQAFDEYHVPIMRAQPGFLRLEQLVNRATNIAVVIIHYDTEGHAAAAVPNTEAWQQARLATARYVMGMPTTQVFEVATEV